MKVLCMLRFTQVTSASLNIQTTTVMFSLTAQQLFNDNGFEGMQQSTGMFNLHSQPTQALDSGCLCCLQVY
jgi:hypothetical protein